MAANAYSQVVTDSLPFLAEPNETWMAILDKDSLKLIKADLIKTPEELHLSAFVNDVSTVSAIAALIKYSDGRVVSNPLHQIGKLEISRESSRVAQERLQRIQSEVEALSLKKKSLKEEAQRLKQSLRHEAGLDDVDKIYEKVDKLEARLKELNTGEQLN